MTDPTEDAAPLLEVRNLQMHFPIRRGFLRRTVGYVRAVDGVNFAVSSGETLGLVGESGCGKTTLARCIVGAYRPSAGQVLYRERDGDVTDLALADGDELRRRRREIRMIFQDPHASLNPRMTLLQIVGEPLYVNGVAKGEELTDRVAALLLRVGLRPEYMHRYPHSFSGGERQRVGIARALALEPRVVIADEAVSALDVSVRAQILNLLQDLQEEYGLTYIFVAHDLSVVEYLCDRVAVMYVGRITEVGETLELYERPRHPYTEALLSAIPRPDPELRATGSRLVLGGDVADPANPPAGCYFHPRCRYAEAECAQHEPELRPIAGTHRAACHYADDLELRGVTREGLVE